MEYDNTNTGFLFKNESGNEKAPAYKGKINVSGHEYELAAWIRVSKSGAKFISLKVQEPRQKSTPVPEPVAGLDDDIPF
jgi:uncharacterized protein (DUF736 family)